MKRFLDDDFLLSTDTSRWLFHDVAASLPLYDYHCHLCPDHLVNNHRFEHLTEIWLAGDHYKWRAMRAAGIAEQFITGDADPFEKFLKWAETVPQTVRNPLYQWTHLELRRYFDIDLLLAPDTAAEIWAEANRQLQNELDTQAILQRFRVAIVGSTDDPLDDLAAHQRGLAGIETRLYPSLRPDRLMAIDGTDEYWDYVERLGVKFEMAIDSLDDLLTVVGQAHRYFHDVGARVSDHALTRFPDVECTAEVAASIFDRARRGESLSQSDRDQFTIFMLRFVGQINAQAGWVQQFHLGAARNANSRLSRQLGADAGCDGIGDGNQEPGLRRFLDSLDRSDQLAKTILYNLNPADNYVFAALAGTFQQGPTRSKVQLGSAWWYLDQQDAMRWQMNALSRLGLLSGFVGMLTDSRSMMSFPRHEYFRRLLCDLIGVDVENGEIPNDRSLLSNLVQDVCFRNAERYFGLEVSPSYSTLCSQAADGNRVQAVTTSR